MRFFMAAMLAFVCLGCAESLPEQRPSRARLDGYPELTREMTKEVIATYGSRLFTATRTEAANAVVTALQSSGFQIAVNEPERGLIKTARRLVTSSRDALFIYCRQYIARINRTDGGVMVTLAPRIFENDFDVTDKPIWNTRAEVKLWQSLFTEVADAIGEKPRKVRVASRAAGD
jgi:hypothetical protein